MFSDEELAAKAVGGDKEAYAEIVRRYEKQIFALAYRMLGNREDARDIAQEAFLKAYRALAAFKESSRFSPWLYAIANNLCIDLLRRKGRNNLSLDEPTLEGGVRQVASGAEADPSFELERREVQEQVRKALDGLPEKYKSILVLRHMQELSYEEIAQSLGISLSLVKTHLFRAREAMRKLLLQGEEGEGSGMPKRAVRVLSGQ